MPQLFNIDKEVLTFVDTIAVTMKLQVVHIKTPKKEILKQEYKALSLKLFRDIKT